MSILRNYLHTRDLCMHTTVGTIKAYRLGNMLNVGITVWNQGLLHNFLVELEAHPQTFSRVTLISPFMNLGSTSPIARRLQRLVSNLLRQEVAVHIVSDLTPARASSFTTFLASQPRFPGFAGLYPKLHSKCGYAISKTGAHIAFVGSANLTDAALARNQEIVLAVKSSPSLPATCDVFNQIKQQADEILARSVGPHRLPAHPPTSPAANN
jgi:phosphatidylserine/phosphatidylglycerophosphate/cardiolipin synthase-like enzyme